MAETEDVQIEENKVEIEEHVEVKQEAINTINTEQDEQKTTKTNPKYTEKVNCDLCGKSISKKNLSTHKKTTCKNRPKETTIKVVPVATQDKPPKPAKLERYPPKATYSRAEAFEENADESDESDGEQDPYNNTIKQAKQLPKAEPPRVLTRVDRLRALVDQAFQ